MRSNNILRTIGVITVAFVLLRAIVWLTLGGTVMVTEATSLGTQPAAAVTMREPVFRAVIPLMFSILTLVGLVREHLLFIWYGGVALLVVGILFMFSLGFEIIIAGGIVLVVAFALSRQAQESESTKAL